MFFRAVFRTFMLLVLVAEVLPAVPSVTTPMAPAAAADPGATEQVSVTSRQQPIGGNEDSHNPSISADGRWIAYSSSATNLVPNPAPWLVSPKQTDIYVFDRLLGTTRRAVTAAPLDSCDVCEGLGEPSISADGSMLAFATDRSFVPEDDSFGTPRVYVVNLRTNALQLVSSEDSCGECFHVIEGSSPSISGDGRMVAFESSGHIDDVSYCECSSTLNVYLRDLSSPQLRIVSAFSGEGGLQAGNDDSFDPSVNADGRYVAFTTFATDLGPSDPNGAGDSVLRRDMNGTAFVHVSQDLDGRTGREPSISGDGSRIAFTMGEPVAEAVPPSLALGSTPQGVMIDKASEFQNTGSGVLTITNIVVPAGFDYLGGGKALLAGGPATAATAVPGTRQAATPSFGRAAVPVQPKVVPAIHNTGLCFVGLNLYGHESCNLDVEFFATTTGTFSGDFVIQYADTPAPVGTSTTIPVTATATSTSSSTSPPSTSPPSTFLGVRAAPSPGAAAAPGPTAAPTTAPKAAPTLAPNTTAAPTTTTTPSSSGVSTSNRSVSSSPPGNSTPASTAPAGPSGSSKLTAPGDTVPIAFSAPVPAPTANQLAGDTNGRDDIFVYDVNAAAYTWASTRNPALCTPSPCVPQDATMPALSQDGATVAWESDSADFVPDDTNGGSGHGTDIFVRDLLAPQSATNPTPPGPIERVSVSSAGQQTENTSDSRNAAISGDGTYVPFDSDSDLLGAGVVQPTCLPTPGVGAAARTAGPSPAVATTLGPPAPFVAAAGPPAPRATTTSTVPASTTSTTSTTAVKTLLGPRTESQPVLGPTFQQVAPGPTASVCGPGSRDVFDRFRQPSLSLQGQFDFGTVEVGADGPHQVLTLTNSGPGPVFVQGPFVNNPDWTIVGTTCTNGTVLRRNQSCTVEVAFRPTTVGPRSANLTIFLLPDNVPSQVQATLTGVGGPPNVGGPAHDFGPVGVGVSSSPTGITITNNGSVPRTLGTFTVTGPFAIANNTCDNATLPPGGSCVITVVFTPGAPGPASGSLNGSVTSTSPPFPISIPLTGTGVPPGVQVSPSPVDFGDNQIGQPAPDQVVTISNNGLGNLVISGVTLTSGGPDYAIGADTCTGKTLAPTQSCTITVKFTPSVVGTRTGEISVATNAPGSPTKIPLTGNGKDIKVVVDPNPLDFGNVAVGQSLEKTLTVKVPGAIAPPNGGFNIGGANPGDFSITSRSCTSQLPEGTSCTVTVRFTPSADGARNATITGTMGAARIAFTGGLTGAGGVPQPVLTPNPVDFGSVVVGQTSPDVVVTLANQGGGMLKPGPAAIGGDNAGDFTLVGDGCVGQSLGGGASCTVTLHFTPSSSGTRTGTLSIPGGGDDPLTGDGAIPPTSPPVGPNPPGTTPPGGTSPPGGTPTTPPFGPVPPGTSNPGQTFFPTIRLSRPLASPGEVVYVDGSGFRPSSQVQLRWLADGGRVVFVATVTTDAAGSFPATPVLIMNNEPAGPRTMEGNGAPDQIASASFLIVPSTYQPSGNDALSIRPLKMLERR